MSKNQVKRNLNKSQNLNINIKTIYAKYVIWDFELSELRGTLEAKLSP
jgi:chaperonin cofactor prefoldin